MAKNKKVSFSLNHSSIDEIEEYYLDSENALDQYYKDIASLNYNSRFIGYTKEEILNALTERKLILGRMCSLEILAALEARVRIDYLVRCQNKLKDLISRELRKVHKIKKNKASLVDDIISTWRQFAPVHKTRLDKLQNAIDLRNWLAHGRYWQPTQNPHILKYDYLSICLLASEILTNIDLLESS